MKAIFSSSLILLLSMGCRKSNISTGNKYGTDIFPNKIGDTWVYLVNDTTFTFQNATSARQYNMTVSVIDSVQLPGGIKANVWVYNYSGGADTNFVFQHGDTISFAANTMTSINIVKQYIVPLRLHNSWPYSTNSIHDITVDSLSDIIAGQNHFENAYHIQGYPGRPDEMFNIDEWLADHVGVAIRYFNNVHTSTNPYRHITTWTLDSYHLE
jgi:hypothetical protein